LAQAAVDPSGARQFILLNMQLNGEPVTLAVPAHWTLLEALRYGLGATGSKQGCDKGDCGACTVLVGGQPVLSCLTMAAAMQGKAVETVEGLGVGGEPHPLQQAFAQLGAAQCGFCTPRIHHARQSFIYRKPTSNSA
jgi:aerobic-type carbon monoxide dehydrogenase small subunit (CoxS/CutS family)